MLEETYRQLAVIFSDYKKFERLISFDYADHVTDIIHNELKCEVVKYKDDPVASEMLARADRHHRTAMEKLGVTL
ncbi:hypothetical protein [Pseudomonas sp. R2-37-08W]|uniref:hypothetical protein n=1 Tax=Pseudomonas sp. R2-37-08W TaxID=1173273 RepID=UPI000F58D4A5|nr:hypothetical protein [Pseudomonas sp. R2-37-08W]